MCYLFDSVFLTSEMNVKIFIAKILHYSKECTILIFTQIKIKSPFKCREHIKEAIIKD